MLPLLACLAITTAADPEGQPLAANVERVLAALDSLGRPMSGDVTKSIREAVKAQDAKAILAAVDPQCLAIVTINPEARVKVAKGSATVTLQQAGWTPVLIKVVNESTVKKPLAMTSPQAGPVQSGAGLNQRAKDADASIVKRFAEVAMHTSPPMTGELSGLSVEYMIGLIYSTESGKREISLAFDLGLGTQDLGFRGEVPIVFDINPAHAITLTVKDHDGTPTVGRFTFTDAAGHVYPPQAKRLGVDLFFQKQIYRGNGETVLLPPGKFVMESGRGPEYRLEKRELTITGPTTVRVDLKRWIDPAKLGWYSGDHHIHAAGCAHYTNPTEGIRPEEMFAHVKGEGLNVGCCLTWGPCYDYQRQFFSPEKWEKSDPFTVLKYDVEVSGFGSQALGHVCLLNLKDQTYPGSEGTKQKGWPTWTTPLMKWAKEQGAVTGYAHSANGLNIRPDRATRRLFVALDPQGKGWITKDDAANGAWPLPESFERLDADGDGKVTEVELAQGTLRTVSILPNLNIPEMNGIGAQEVCVSTAHGVCDFLSAMDTERVPEWNCWYHLMNCGFPLKISGETDFPCISGGRVGQGRVYVKLGMVKSVDFATWCEGIRQGNSYVSDGYAHALDFMVDGVTLGAGAVKKQKPSRVKVKAKVAFASEMPLGTAIGGRVEPAKQRLLELVQNGKTVAKQMIPADDRVHEVTFEIDVAASSWLALRSGPQLHTNPINVLIGEKPIRASRDSAKWCIGVIEQLWSVREKDIRAGERDEAKKAFEKAKAIYRTIAAESVQP